MSAIKQEVKTSPEKFNCDVLLSLDDLKLFWECYKKQNRLPDGSLPKDHPDPSLVTDLGSQVWAERKLTDINEGKEMCLGVKVDDKMVATGRLIFSEVGGKKQAFLASLTVDNEFQGRGMANKMIGGMKAEAVKNSCETLVAEVLIKNKTGPFTMLSLFKEGFVLDAVARDKYGKGSGVYIIHYYVNPELVGDEADKNVPERRVDYGNLDGIEELLENDWKGVRVERGTDLRMYLIFKKFQKK